MSTELKSDKIMYKACPTEKCNKSVVSLDNEKYRCEKCAQEFTGANGFRWRYILRGAIADATNYQVIMQEGASITYVDWVLGFFTPLS